MAPSKPRSVSRGVATAALVVLVAYLLGSATIEYRFFPYEQMRKIFVGIEVMRQLSADRPSYSWMPARTTATGVTRYNPARTYPGYTLLTSAHAQKALLIDMGGNVVHEWGRNFSELWDETADTKAPFEDRFVHLRELYLYPNGDLLAIYIGPGDTPWGYGLVKFDKDSNVVWKYLRNVHHDVTVGKDGTIHTLTHRIRADQIPGLDRFPAPILEDFLTILSPDGEELRSISLLAALRDSRWAGLLDTAPLVDTGDYLHANAVDVVTADYAADVPIANPGEVLVSLRNMETIALIDVEREVVTWAMRGPWQLPHDPDMLPGGTMLIFDNLGHYGKGGRSRVVEFDPLTRKIVWRYTGDAADPLESLRISEQQRLPNGNTLITESYQGRVIEVTPGKKIVWEYISPFRQEGDPATVAVLSSAQRFAADWFEFDFNNGP